MIKSQTLWGPTKYFPSTRTHKKYISVLFSRIDMSALVWFALFFCEHKMPCPAHSCSSCHWHHTQRSMVHCFRVAKLSYQIKNAFSFQRSAFGDTRRSTVSKLTDGLLVSIVLRIGTRSRCIMYFEVLRHWQRQFDYPPIFRRSRHVKKYTGVSPTPPPPRLVRGRGPRRTPTLLGSFCTTSPHNRRTIPTILTLKLVLWVSHVPGLYRLKL